METIISAISALNIMPTTIHVASTPEFVTTTAVAVTFGWYSTTRMYCAFPYRRTRVSHTTPSASIVRAHGAVMVVRVIQNMVSPCLT